jgi:hypothetical protein
MEDCQITIQKAWPWNIVNNVVWECPACQRPLLKILKKSSHIVSAPKLNISPLLISPYFSRGSQCHCPSCPSLPHFCIVMRPSRNGPHYVIRYGGQAFTQVSAWYIGSLPNLATWFPCGKGRTLFILGSKVKVTVTINKFFDNRVVSA